MKKHLKLLLKISVSFILLFLIYIKVDKVQLLEHFKLLNYTYIPLIVLLISSNYIVSSIRWKSLLIYEKTEHVSVWYLTSLYFIGSFFNNFMPTSIGGDVYKVFKLGRKIDNMSNAFMATFMERFTGVLVLMVISLFATYKYIGLLVIPLLLLFLLGIYVAIMLLGLLSKKFSKLKKIYSALEAYKDKKAVLAWALLTSLIVQLISVFTQFFIYKAIGVNLHVMDALIFFPLITLAGFFIPSLNGVGVQDYLYMNLFFTFSGIATSISLAASILYHFFRLGVSLIGGILYALGKAD